MNILKLFINPKDKKSFMTKFRQKNFNEFINLTKSFPKPIRILDLGGTQEFWQMMNYTDIDKVYITIVNNANENDVTVTLPNFTLIRENVLDITDFDYDVIFSHSLIEHISNPELLCYRIIKSGKPYYIQTPNRNFPIEPHHLFPMFQFLPFQIQLFIFKYIKSGWFSSYDRNHPKDTIKSINLLNKKEIRSMFQHGRIIDEKILCFTQSFIITNIE